MNKIVLYRINELLFFCEETKYDSIHIFPTVLTRKELALYSHISDGSEKKGIRIVFRRVAKGETEVQGASLNVEKKIHVNNT